MKKNCWEFKQCGREPGGIKSGESGVCPSSTEKRLHGVHGGTNAGRACWIVGGTYCKDDVEGSFALQYDTCSSCDFYSDVRRKEGAQFLHTTELLKKLSRG